jgi:hypothetical protein
MYQLGTHLPFIHLSRNIVMGGLGDTKVKLDIPRVVDLMKKLRHVTNNYVSI